MLETYEKKILLCKVTLFRTPFIVVRCFRQTWLWYILLCTLSNKSFGGLCLQGFYLHQVNKIIRRGAC